mgnify:CR=1 FL=1
MMSVAEFERLINLFIHREDPDALSFQALDEAMREQLAPVMITGTGVTDSNDERSILKLEDWNEGLFSTTLEAERDDDQRS